MGEPAEERSVKKIVIIVLLLVAAVTGVAAVHVVPPIIFRQRVEDGLEAVMKTSVDVGDADISFNLSSGYIQGIVVHNPPDYKTKAFLEVPKITFEINNDSIGSGPLRFKHITIHEPVLYMETVGETSNLKDMIELMLQPSDVQAPPIIIDELNIENGKVSALFEYGDGKPIISDFPIEKIESLEGNAEEISEQLALALKGTMDEQVKEARKLLNGDFFGKFKNLFKRD